MFMLAIHIDMSAASLLAKRNKKDQGKFKYNLYHTWAKYSPGSFSNHLNLDRDILILKWNRLKKKNQ